jgi:Uma2 family endonuclease
MVITALKSYSFAEYCHYNDNTDNRYELVDGHLEIMTPPSFRHLLIADQLKEILNQEIKRQHKSLICLSELGVRTGWKKSRIVDLAVISRSQIIDSLEQTAICEIPPLLAIEIVSPDSIQRDYRYKRSEYAAVGIAEYWIVDPLEQKITVLTFNEGLYDEQVFLGETAIASNQFPELKITVNEILTIH